ncbi:MAG: TIGR04283 family arsenosugar biosynthesis glycosyltransferase [Chitinophagaceae bacterium]
MISVIIPTFNEEAQIAKTIRWIRRNGNEQLITEIIVPDGGSTDTTFQKARDAGALAVVCPRKGRAAQMNYGASFAKGTVLYFLHADTLPPVNFTEDILQAVSANRCAGCFMLSFDHNHWFLKANCWFTRFNVDAVRFGDQSLFVRRDIFMNAGKFNESLVVLEDQELIKRLKKRCAFIVVKKQVITSARKYLQNGVYRTQGVFFVIYLMYRLGYSQQKLVSTYRKLIQQDKL